MNSVNRIAFLLIFLLIQVYHLSHLDYVEAKSVAKDTILRTANDQRYLLFVGLDSKAISDPLGKDLNHFIDVWSKELGINDLSLKGKEIYTLSLYESAESETDCPAVSSQNAYPFTLGETSLTRLNETLEKLLGIEKET